MSCQRPTVLTRRLLLSGIAFAFLRYFEYLTFMEGTINDLFGTWFVLTQIILPLGISFITFQRIAFRVAKHAGRMSAFTFRDFVLFVLFFPQLVADPIVHDGEIMPQFQGMSRRLDAENTAIGISLFFCGLAKKLALADPLSPLVAPLYPRCRRSDFGSHRFPDRRTRLYVTGLYCQ